MVDIEKKEIALKASSVQILVNDQKTANIAFELICPTLKSWIFECNLQSIDVSAVRIKSKFWEDVLRAWCSFHYSKPVDPSHDILIWYNSDIRINDTPFLWKNCFVRGLCRNSQLYSDGQLKDPKEVEENFGLDFWNFGALIDAVPKEHKCFSPRLQKQK